MCKCQDKVELSLIETNLVLLLEARKDVALLYVSFVEQKPLKKCQLQRKEALKNALIVGGKVIPPQGVHIPICEADGTFSAIQCDQYLGGCWCVDQNGNEKAGTRTQDGKPKCQQRMFLIFSFLHSSLLLCVNSFARSLSYPFIIHLSSIFHPFVTKARFPLSPRMSQYRRGRKFSLRRPAILQHSATLCNTLQHSATLCDSMEIRPNLSLICHQCVTNLSLIFCKKM